jgi:hypothetical protein
VNNNQPSQRSMIQEALDALFNDFRVAIIHDWASLSRHGARKPTLLAIGALSWAVGFGAIGFMWGKRMYPEDQSSFETLLNRGAEARAAKIAPAPTTSMSALPQRDISSIKKAMASCDAEATNNPDGLYFLVTPVVPATFEGATSLLPSGTTFGSLVLLISQDLLSGLELGVLAASASPYDFSIMDLEAAQTVKWSASGPSKFKRENSPEVSKFQLAFDFGGNTLTWTPPFDRQKGNCYWVNVRLPGLPLRARSTWETLIMPSSFSLPFLTVVSSPPPEGGQDGWSQAGRVEAGPKTD